MVTRLARFLTCISFCGAEGGQIHKHKAVDQRRKPSQDRPKKELFVEAASLQCVRLEICKRMGNPRNVAPARRLLCVCYAFLAMRGTREARGARPRREVRRARLTA